MAEFLLIHGSCHGAWCWRDLIPALAALGHGARAIDLPAHGADATPAADATLELYADRILAAIDGPVTLVGHSAAGYPITLAAERAPDRIARLVYLCAYVPVPGLSMIDMRRAGPRQLLGNAVRAAPDGTIVGRKLIKSSGNKAWDEAVLKAIDKTAVLPRDIDGTVPPVLEINFRRRD